MVSTGGVQCIAPNKRIMRSTKVGSKPISNDGLINLLTRSGNGQEDVHGKLGIGTLFPRAPSMRNNAYLKKELFSVQLRSFHVVPSIAQRPL